MVMLRVCVFFILIHKNKMYIRVGVCVIVRFRVGAVGWCWWLVLVVVVV